MTRQDLIECAHDNNIKIVIAKSTSYNRMIAVHLLNPNLEEIEDAIEAAVKDNFETIVIHSVLTWPK